MTDKELATHYRSHLDRVTKELISTEMVVRRLEKTVEDLSRTKLVTPNYEGQIDFEGGWGFLEHNEYGEEDAVRFFFDKEKDGSYTINDYEFCYEMNDEMLSCLNQYKIFLVEY